MRIPDLPTPALLIDAARAQRNCDAMRAKARASKVTLRPHVKTHKTIEGARMQLGARTGPITVSTLREAEFFASEGFEDITLAVPLPSTKIERAVMLSRRVRRFGVLLDDPGMLAALEEASAVHGVRFPVWVEIDSGAHRTGLRPDAPETLLLIRSVADSRRVRFEGLLTHAGHSYTALTASERSYVAREEIEALVRLRRRLTDFGVETPALSVGATPTASSATAFDGADEVRPGNYIFYDAWQVALGSCTVDDCAASVLTTVIGVYPAEARVVIDAGSLALTHEPPLHPEDGWGIVCNVEGHPLPFNVQRLSQEHGELLYQPLAPPRKAAGEGYDEARAIGDLRVGSRLRIIPNHACITAAMFGEYHVVDRDEVKEVWRPVHGW